jgi:hypothetical protein
MSSGEKNSMKAKLIDHSFFFTGQIEHYREMGGPKALGNLLGASSECHGGRASRHHTDGTQNLLARDPRF